MMVHSTLPTPCLLYTSYLFLSDETGDMALAVSDMGIYEELTPAYFARHQGYLNGAALVVADANLPAGALAYLADHLSLIHI